MNSLYSHEINLTPTPFGLISHYYVKNDKNAVYIQGPK